MGNPQLVYDLMCMRQREMRRNADTARLALVARVPSPRLDARLLLPLANSFIALGMRLRRRYQPGESFALVPLAHLPETFGRHPNPPSVGRQPASLIPVLAFQVIQCLPQRTTNLTYWSLLPPTTGAADTTSRLGLLCLARPLE
ncbi:MAG TPA: hypothetical protein VKQ30_18715 [Ktedonobacterales bacterium]|nr:hypothetical protein [Ktedonobacterales bacterium]